VIDVVINLFVCSATIEINSVEYGKGFGTSKKIAKSEAARLTLELLIPEFKKVVTKNGTIVNNDNGESVIY
jgi:hypothetical protein